MATTRMAPGGKATVVLGEDSVDYVTDSGAVGEGSAQAVAVPEARVRQAPGGTTSIAIGAGAEQVLSAEELLARPSPGGVASIDFSADQAASTTVPRGSPGGATTVILGSDSTEWSTNSSAHGVGSADAAAAMEPRVRAAPGGKDSVDFGAEHQAPSVEELLSRQAPGGTVSLNFAPAAPEAAAVRGPVGGQTTVMLGNNASDWSTTQGVHGVGSVEAVLSTPSKPRPAPGGTASVDLAATTPVVDAETLLARNAPGGVTTIDFGAEALPSPSPTKGPVGGKTTLDLGKHATDWSTSGAVHGVGSVEAVAVAEPRERVAPGGVVSVAFGAGIEATSKEELLARPSPGGPASVNFGGQAPAIDPAAIRGPVGGEASIHLGEHGADWSTNSAALGVGSADAIAQAEPRGPRGSPGGAVSIEFGKAAETASAEALLARPYPGGVDSVDFTALPTTGAPTKGPVGGTASVVLGGDSADWSTNSSTMGTGSASAVAAAAAAIDSKTGPLRSAPGGDSVICLGGSDKGPNAEALLARSSPGGTTSVDFAGDHGHVAGSSRGYPGGPSSLVLGGDTTTWSGKSSDWCTSSSALNAEVFKAPEGAGEGRQAPGGTSTLVLGGGVDDVTPTAVSSNRFADGSSQNSGNFITNRPSTKLHQAPGGNSSIVLGGDAEDVQPLESSNAFAAGSDPNAGNVITDKPSIQLKQAPGGTSSIVLGGDVSEGVESSNKFANGASQNTGNVITDRPSTKLHQAPGGNSTIVLGCDEEESMLPSTKVNQAPGGNSTVVLGCDDQESMQPSTKVNQAPGGNSTVVLGCDDEEEESVRPSTKLNQAPGGNSTVVLGCDDEEESMQPSTKVNQAPGGNSTVVLGCDEEESARPSTKLHQAPGGNSTVVLGCVEESVHTDSSASKEDAQERVDTSSTISGAAGGLRERGSANRFANGSSQNTGNFLTERSTTKLHQAPGGTSTICLGSDSNAITSEKKQAPIQDENADVNKKETSEGTPAVVLG